MRAELADDGGEKGERSTWLVLNSADTFDFTTPLYQRITRRMTLTACAHERLSTRSSRRGDSNWKLRWGGRTFSARRTRSGVRRRKIDHYGTTLLPPWRCVYGHRPGLFFPRQRSFTLRHQLVSLRVSEFVHAEINFSSVPQLRKKINFIPYRISVLFRNLEE